MRAIWPEGAATVASPLFVVIAGRATVGSSSEDDCRGAAADESGFGSFGGTSTRFPFPLLRGLFRPPVGGLLWEDGAIVGGIDCASTVPPLEAKLDSSEIGVASTGTGVGSSAKVSVAVRDGSGFTGYTPSTASHSEGGNDEEVSGTWYTSVLCTGEDFDLSTTGAIANGWGWDSWTIKGASPSVV